MEGGVVEGSTDCVSIDKMLQASNKTKTGKVHGPSDASLELFVISEEVGIRVTADLCHRVLDGFGMPAE